MEKRSQTWTRAAAGVGYLSNRHYNQGLALARQKKLSKAQRALEISLKYNKYNKDARNLLGLIEYSRGEAGQAVAAWAVSAGLNSENNIAHTYIKAIQKCPEGREGIDRPHKRYNRALLAAMDGNTDIAAIELKKAVKERPNYVRAKQLLALICIKNGQRREAGRWLESSLEDDRDNEDSMKWLRLLQEDGQGRKGLKKADRPSKRKKTDKKISVGFLKSAAVWMAAGAAAAAAAGFMFVPVLSGQMKHVMDAQVLEYSRILSEKNIQIDALKQQLSQQRETEKETFGETQSRMTVR